ncbi:MAG: DUF1622 domain-containing protein [Chloroflexi bacterium]|nr:DUF1622 domain-containing protein [Chloroflexota bacterium]
MDALIRILTTVAFGIGFIGILVIVWGVILGLVDLIRAEVRRFRSHSRTMTFERVRHDMAFHLLLGLEFMIAADIVRTIANPTLQELAILGSIVAIRTAISYFLNREIGRTGTKL